MKTSLVSVTLATLAAVSALALAACSSSDTSTGGTTPAQDPGATGDTGAATAPDKNPNGAPYPTANIGTSPRSGNTAGNVMQNFKFLGYKDGVIANGLSPMSLADFYDPKGDTYRLIRVQAAGSWCPHCVKETQTVATLPAELKSRKVAWIVSLAEGPVQGTGATKGDLDVWIGKYQAPFTHFLDPANHNFGAFYDAAALPWNATIDAKTMEILGSEVGGLENPTDLLANIDSYIAQLK